MKVAFTVNILKLLNLVTDLLEHRSHSPTPASFVFLPSSCCLKVSDCAFLLGASPDHLQVSSPVSTRVPPAVPTGQPEKRRRVSQNTFVHRHQRRVLGEIGIL